MFTKIGFKYLMLEWLNNTSNIKRRVKSPTPAGILQESIGYWSQRSRQANCRSPLPSSLQIQRLSLTLSTATTYCSHCPVLPSSVSHIHHLQMKFQHSPRESHMVNNLFLRVGCRTSSSCSTENKLSGIFRGSSYHSIPGLFKVFKFYL